MCLGWSFLDLAWEAKTQALIQGQISTTELHHSGNIKNVCHVLLMVERVMCRDPKPNHVGEYSISKSKSLG